MDPDDIPTEITKLVYTAPKIGGFGPSAVRLSQNEAAEFLAHFWPAIERHVREQVATEPIIARWSKGVTHHDGGTTVECVDAENPLRGIALELDPDDREALGLSLVDPDGEMDQADDEGDDPYGGHFRYCYVRDDSGSLCSCGHAAAIARQADDTTSKEA